jgi:hypothetical protein
MATFTALQLEQIFDKVNQSPIDAIAKLQTQLAQLQMGHSNEATLNSVKSGIRSFHYDPQADETFDRWFERNGKIIESTEAELDEEALMLSVSKGKEVLRPHPSPIP